MIKSLFEKSILHSLNRILKLDTIHSESSIKLEGIRISVLILPFSSAWRFKIQDRQWVLDDSDQISDLILQGKPSDFVKTLLQFFSKKNLNQAPIQIQGNMEIALELMNLIQNNQFDVVEWISHYVGDVPAHYLETAFEKTQSLISTQSKQFQEDLRDYLQDESELLITKHEHQSFCHQVDALRLSVDRIWARVQRLEKQILPKDAAT